jgi:hypothetical protein
LSILEKISTKQAELHYNDEKKIITNFTEDIKNIGNDFNYIKLFDINGNYFFISTINNSKDYIFLRFFSNNCQNCYKSMINAFNQASLSSSKMNFAFLTNFTQPNQLLIFKKENEIRCPCFSTLKPIISNFENSSEPYIIVVDQSGHQKFSCLLAKENTEQTRNILFSLLKSQ